MNSKTAAAVTVEKWAEMNAKGVNRADLRKTGPMIALFITGFCTFVGLYATQPLLPQFRAMFHVSELAASLTVGATVLAVSLAAPWIGSFADAIGRKRVIVAAMIGLAVPTFLAATSANLEQVVFWRFWQGVFTPGIIAVAMAYISEEAPANCVGSTMSTYISGTIVGGFAGRMMTGLVASVAGWRMSFVVLGAATLAGGLATWKFLPRSTQFVRQRNLGASLRTLPAHLKNPQLLAVYAAGFNVLFSLVAAFTYVNYYLADKPFNLGPVALASIFAVYLVGAAVTPIAGKILDRVGSRVALAGAASVTAGGMLLTLVPQTPIIIAGLAVVASGAFACQATASSYVGKVAGKARSSASGLYVAFYYFGGCVGSILPGFVWKQAGWTGCAVIVVAVQALSAAIAWRFWKS